MINTSRPEGDANQILGYLGGLKLSFGGFGGLKPSCGGLELSVLFGGDLTPE